MSPRWDYDAPEEDDEIDLPPAHAILAPGDAAMLAAARDRTRVRIPGPRFGTLIYWPLLPSARASIPRGTGARARIRLESGAYVSVDKRSVELV